MITHRSRDGLASPRLTFSSDGSHYLPWDAFLSKGYDFWASGKAGIGSAPS